jgi:hypothetical protein
MLALQIGEQRHGSDVFALVPVLTDQISLSAIRQAADYLVAGLRDPHEFTRTEPRG